ncbi:MAG: tRNA adenosine(34) deaminase TadA [Lachnospiraceae bacterium]|nr:tRNA adenosine(34) deaminase TadA [Lachnospiraceae bacterium]
MNTEKEQLIAEIEALNVQEAHGELATANRRRRARLKRKLEAICEEEKRLEKEDALDLSYMKEAVRLAKKAAAIGEVPIGCVIVYDGEIIAKGYNRRNADKSTLSHAEMTAIRRASKKLDDWRLEECTLYVTLEPCQMCAGAIVQARIPRVVIGTMNPKAGCAGSILDLFHVEAFNHQVEVKTGVAEDECKRMLRLFFADMRRKRTTQN